LQRQNSRVEFGNSVETFLRIVTGGLLSVFGKGNTRKLTTPTAAIASASRGAKRAQRNVIKFSNYDFRKALIIMPTDVCLAAGIARNATR
jgi:hypothetical protein